jgi:hypothetical protein
LENAVYFEQFQDKEEFPSTQGHTCIHQGHQKIDIDGRKYSIKVVTPDAVHVVVLLRNATGKSP